MPDHTLTGNIREHRGFRSKILGNRRNVLVYLPRGYRRWSRKRYPVLYLHDGQNVFDAATAFNGVEWGVDETAQRLIRTNLIEPLIIVAVANTGEERIHEYAPTRGKFDKRRRSKGLLKDYGRFLVEELKPFIDSKYRTQRGAESTALGGSSLGGLATLVLGLWFPQVFSRLAVLSPSVWWDDSVIYGMVESLEDKLPLKIWLDTGTHEEGWERARKLCELLMEKGWRLFDDLEYHEIEGGDHSEGSWAMRVDPVLRFLFPPLPPGKKPAQSPLVLEMAR
jgi:predicted alpha/beta superfamily hydrolase